MPDSMAIVREKNEGTVLFECPMEEMQMAYTKARELEEMGLEVEVITPDIHQSLAETLGIPPEKQDEYLESLEAEIDDHN